MKIPRFIPAEVSELEPFVTAGVFGSTEVQAVTTFVRAAASQGDAVTRDVIIAAALAVRAPMHGHVCVDLGSIASTVVGNQDFSSGALTDDEVDSTGALAGEEDAGLDQDQDSTGDPVLDQQQLLDNLKWPDSKTWMKNVARSSLVRVVTSGDSASDSSIDLATQLQPLVVEDGRLYLTRFWSLERYVAADLLHRSQAATVEEEEQTSDGVLPSEEFAAAEVTRLFQESGGPVDNDQLQASLAGVHRNFVVISGGPGTGKTTTVATFLAGLVSSMQPPAGSGSNSTNQATQRIALAAPTGKAAARMTEAIRKAINNLGGALDPEVAKELGELDASTIHRLLGASPGTGFRHNPSNPLPHDIVIVDEVSMVSLSLMAHLLAAIRPDAKVVLVGDPYQLASIEAGAVLGDIVGIGSGGGAVAGTAPPAAIAESVRVLTTVHRQGKDSGILKLAECIRQGDADGAMEILKGANEDVIWVDPTNPDHKGEKIQAEQDLKHAATKVVRAAQGENAEIEKALEAILSVKVLSALRRGPTGVDHWNQLVENYLRSEDLKGYSDWYAGRPVMVTKNDYLNGVFNGDVGVAIAKEDLNRDDRFQVWFERAEGNQMVEATRLDQIATQWAMSIHKSQGSEFEHVVVSMPPPPSRILTRELLYTAVTRAKEKLTIVATEESITEAIKREVARSSGLAARLANPTS
ncbi:DNA helicase/exodeoxyribonuclease V, alpha subunit [Actinobacteria bacterium IMCC26207]|nr:DNA helicase/exodeoxyribonuclease V, alpha subunit [Actinobacteria bacterium IMCC26207]